MMDRAVILVFNMQSNGPHPLIHAPGCLVPLCKLNQYIFGLANSEQNVQF